MHAIRFLLSFVYFQLAHMFSLSLFRPCLASGNIKGKCNSIWVTPGGEGRTSITCSSEHPHLWVQPMSILYPSKTPSKYQAHHQPHPPLRTSRVNPGGGGGRGDRANLRCLQLRATTLRPANGYSYSGKFNRNSKRITPLLRPFPLE